ncbi:thiamine-binding protein [Blastococcus capsensis]|uniref:thiamine-binding protein n=1 Tax=Blastococcus capsensis TaxID=1564163 RepID=UPI0025420C2C|nr:thiamine-binding protein [Blastococcus capsensis]MDK3256424.1 thiamine-binding protein [Blastococcus capsensis]
MSATERARSPEDTASRDERPDERQRGGILIAEIQVAPSPPGTAENPHAHVEAAIAVIQASGLRYEVGALGTTLEGEADEVWATLRAAHEAMLAAGVTAGLSHVKVASVNRTMDSLTAKFR